MKRTTMSRGQFWGTAILTALGFTLIVLAGIIAHGSWVVGLMLIGVGVWFGPCQPEFWVEDKDK